MAKGGRGKRGGKSKSTKRKVMKRVMSSEIASMKQNISGKPGAFSANIVYALYNWSLSNCDRAIQVAQAYQEYRISKVEIRVKPNADTYSIGTSSARSSVPYLYYVVDKTGSLFYQNVNFNSLRDAGAKPLRLDDKTRTIVFKPAVLQQGFDAATGNAPWSTYKVSPWLTTNANNMSATNPWAPNSTDHLGMVLGIEQEETAGGIASFDLDFVVHFQFRKPRNFSATGPSTQKVIVDLNPPSDPSGPPYVPGLLDT